MDLYSKWNSLAPIYLSRDNHDQLNKDNATDFPPTDDPVYILGNKYSSLHELDDIRLDVRSNLWMTYRRNFTTIGETNFTSDSGWGCMLRCGQMVLARAFLNLHLGRNWRWTYPDLESLKKLLSSENKEEMEKYLLYRNIVKLFLDLKTATYSIHQIALMGVCEGKNVGQWFGPNTIAQVLRKLSAFDKMNNIHIYVALDNVVFLDDIRKNCSIDESTTNIKNNETKCQEESESTNIKKWKPLILFIPLRLGLSEINPVYFRALKTTFTFPQTLGVLGGRPNHALYFIGCCGDDLIYLDPHTTQLSVQIAQNLEEINQMLEQEEPLEDLPIESSSSLPVNCSMLDRTDDDSYHCERPYRMSIRLLDPSLSLCFFCKTEEEFNHWTTLCRRKLFGNDEQPLFEILNTRPDDWPPNEDIEFCAQPNDLTAINQLQQTIPNETNHDDQTISDQEDDEEFEIIN